MAASVRRELAEVDRAAGSGSRGAGRLAGRVPVQRLGQYVGQAILGHDAAIAAHKDPKGCGADYEIDDGDKDAATDHDGAPGEWKPLLSSIWLNEA